MPSPGLDETVGMMGAGRPGTGRARARERRSIRGTPRWRTGAGSVPNSRDWRICYNCPVSLAEKITMEAPGLSDTETVHSAVPVGAHTLGPYRASAEVAPRMHGARRGRYCRLWSRGRTRNARVARGRSDAAPRARDHVSARAAASPHDTQEPEVRARVARSARGCAGRWTGGTGPDATVPAGHRRGRARFAQPTVAGTVGAVAAVAIHRVAVGCTGETPTISRSR